MARDSLTIRDGSANVLASSPTTLIAPLSPTRVQLRIQNASAVNSVYIGGSGVTVGGSARVIGGAGNPREAILVTKAAVYGIADPGDQSVTYLEELE